MVIMVNCRNNIPMYHCPPIIKRRSQIALKCSAIRISECNILLHCFPLKFLYITKLTLASFIEKNQYKELTVPIKDGSSTWLKPFRLLPQVFVGDRAEFPVMRERSLLVRSGGRSLKFKLLKDLISPVSVSVSQKLWGTNSLPILK